MFTISSDSKCFDCIYACGADEIGTYCMHPEIRGYESIVLECNFYEQKPIIMKKLCYKITFLHYPQKPPRLPQTYTAESLEEAKKKIERLKEDGCEIISFHEETIKELPF